MMKKARNLLLIKIVIVMFTIAQLLMVIALYVKFSEAEAFLSDLDKKIIAEYDLMQVEGTFTTQHVVLLQRTNQDSMELLAIVYGKIGEVNNLLYAIITLLLIGGMFSWIVILRRDSKL